MILHAVSLIHLPFCVAAEVYLWCANLRVASRKQDKSKERAVPPHRSNSAAKIARQNDQLDHVFCFPKSAMMKYDRKA
jgi:hypothetical protein